MACNMKSVMLFEDSVTW